ncbi:MAG: prephenate dehydrogenase/arogenate dehydrogenase family protein [Acidobacteriaceae bacterium]|nr:prephenate dehydrogenase/arogenate dehydrogenase family protein [Acidobacteriaceae bacterium]
MIQRITIIGTGLIGTSVGLALRAAGFSGQVSGYDASAAEADEALRMGAVNEALRSEDATLAAAAISDVVVLAVPVFAILDWMPKLAAVMKPGRLVTDMGSTKLEITKAAAKYFSGDGAAFLPGHPMAGKESGGAALGEAALFQNAMWLFTPAGDAHTPVEAEWRAWVAKFGCQTMDLDAARHDVLCAWVSHLPQMVSTALSALLEDEFGGAEDMRAIGGRALREMTRLGASPYSMWRDVAMSNTVPLADTLLALEQRLAHLRENLKTPELREEFSRANRFRSAVDSAAKKN